MCQGRHPGGPGGADPWTDNVGVGQGGRDAQKTGCRVQKQWGVKMHGTCSNLQELPVMES